MDQIETDKLSLLKTRNSPDAELNPGQLESGRSDNLLHLNFLQELGDFNTNYLGLGSP